MTVQILIGIACFLVVLTITAFWFYNIGNKKDPQINTATLILFFGSAIATTLFGLGFDNSANTGMAIAFGLGSVSLISYILGQSNITKPKQ